VTHLGLRAGSSLVVCLLAALPATTQSGVSGYYVSGRALELDLPEDLADVEGSYSVRISRACWRGEPDLVRVSESLFPPRDIVEAAAAVAWEGLDEIPEVPDLWWTEEFDGIRIPYAITGPAVRYYMDLSEAWRRGDFSGSRGLTVEWSRFEYEATCDHYESYYYGAELFEDVFVVRLKLDWLSRGGEHGMLRFDKERVVVFDTQAEPLAVFGDENSYYSIF
jgi:hypothetical protein